MILKITACSIIGARSDNEDNLLIGKFKKPAILNNDVYLFDPQYIELKNHSISFAVCDGMGGKANGAQISLTVVKELIKYTGEIPADDVWVKINEKCRNKIPNGGSTCSLVTIKCEDDNINAIFQSIGDSFLYHYKAEKDEIKLMTPLDNQAAKYIAEGKTLKSNELKQAGCVLLNYIGKSYEEGIPIHRNESFVESGDKIIIASDGISELSPKQIIDELFNENFGQNTAFSIACSAINKCSEYPADNTTVIVLEFEK